MRSPSCHGRLRRTGDRRVLEKNYEARSAGSTTSEDGCRRATGSLAEHGADGRAPARPGHALQHRPALRRWLTPSTMEAGPCTRRSDRAGAHGRASSRPMFQASTLTIARASSRRAREGSGAAALAARAAEVRAAFASEYVDAVVDLPVRLQGVYVLALAFDMVPPARGQHGRPARRTGRSAGDRLDTGFLSTPYLFDVLFDNGYPGRAALLRQSEMPSWLYEVDHGATTISETWDAISPDGESARCRSTITRPGVSTTRCIAESRASAPTSAGYRSCGGRTRSRDRGRAVAAQSAPRAGAAGPWSGRRAGMRLAPWGRSPLTCRTA